MNPDALVEKPYLFVVGCPLSGTRLLQRLLQAHPSIGVVPDLCWVFDRIRYKELLLLEQEITENEWDSVLSHRCFRHLDLDPSLFAIEEKTNYADLLEQIVFRYKWIQSKSFVGISAPQCVQNISSLHSCWPDARFIHVIRDGRDVSLSIVHWTKADRKIGRYETWQRDRLATAALYWKQKVLLGRQARMLCPELYYEVFYESLLAQPETELQKLCNFLDVPFSISMVQYLEHPFDTVFPGGCEDWRTQMPVADQKKSESLVGEFLEHLGYSRAFPKVSGEEKNYASEMTDRFIQELKSRKEAIPRNMRH